MKQLFFMKLLLLPAVLFADIITIDFSNILAIDKSNYANYIVLKVEIKSVSTLECTRLMGNECYKNSFKCLYQNNTNFIEKVITSDNSQFKIFFKHPNFEKVAYQSKRKVGVKFSAYPEHDSKATFESGELEVGYELWVKTLVWFAILKEKELH